MEKTMDEIKKELQNARSKKVEAMEKRGQDEAMEFIRGGEVDIDTIDRIAGSWDPIDETSFLENDDLPGDFVDDPELKIEEYLEAYRKGYTWAYYNFRQGL